MGQKELRTIARKALAEFLEGKRTDPGAANIAVQVLHAPQHKGE